VGLVEPSDDAKAQALQAYDDMIERLEAIRDEVVNGKVVSISKA